MIPTGQWGAAKVMYQLPLPLWDTAWTRNSKHIKKEPASLRRVLVNRGIPSALVLPCVRSEVIVGVGYVCVCV